MYKPDFDNLKNDLLCRDRKSVPLIELHIDEGFKQRYLLRKPESLEDETRKCHQYGATIVF